MRPSTQPPEHGLGAVAPASPALADARLLPLGPRAAVTEAESAELVLCYQRGEADALARLHDRLGPIILSVLRPYRTAALPSAVSYQDVAQQAWVILAELAGRWQPRGSFLAYFFRSFPRAIRRYVRTAGAHRGSASTRVVSLPHEEVLRAADALGGRDHESDQILWAQLVEMLTPRQRVALTMHAVDGRRFDEIGAALGISRASAHRLYQGALAILGRAEDTGVTTDPPGAPAVAVTKTEKTDEERLVRVLHALAGPGREVAGRRRAGRLAGIGRERFDRMIADLAAAEAIVERSPGRAGRLVEPSPEQTLARLAAYRAMSQDR